MLGNELVVIPVTEIGHDIPNLLQCSYLYPYFIRYGIGNGFPFFSTHSRDPVITESIAIVPVEVDYSA